MVARRLEEEVREGGGKAKKRGERWEGERERELACLFCMLITDVGKARSRFCWEAFIAHEKAGCLLKKKLSPGWRGREKATGAPQGRGLLLPWSCRVGRTRGTGTLAPPSATVTGWERGSVFRGYFIHGAHRLLLWGGVCVGACPFLYFPVSCSGTCIEASGGG